MIHRNIWWPRYIWCAMFAIAFAYIESSVVVYLRSLYYPDGFSFPLGDMPLAILLTEAGREVATLVVLGTLSRLAVTGRKSRFFLFIYCFGIWDIFYYLWLKVFLDWPATLLDWDVLFLIPLPWVGPVLSPIIISLLFVAAVVTVGHLEARGRSVRFRRYDWLAGIAAAMIIVASYFWETGTVLHDGIPQSYPWWLWCIGVLLGIGVFVTGVIRSGRISRG